MTVKLSQERKVLSLAKKTFGSTRTGRAMRFPVRRLARKAEELGCVYPVLSEEVVGLTSSGE